MAGTSLPLGLVRSIVSVPLLALVEERGGGEICLLVKQELL